jgi:hypothetical protein
LTENPNKKTPQKHAVSGVEAVLKTGFKIRVMPQV